MQSDREGHSGSTSQVDGCGSNQSFLNGVESAGIRKECLAASHHQIRARGRRRIPRKLGARARLGKRSRNSQSSKRRRFKAPAKSRSKYGDVSDRLGSGPASLPDSETSSSFASRRGGNSNHPPHAGELTMQKENVEADFNVAFQLASSLRCHSAKLAAPPKRQQRSTSTGKPTDPLSRRTPGSRQLTNNFETRSAAGGTRLFVWVVGRAYRPENQDGLYVGQELLLLRDPDNQFDRNAVGVHKGTKSHPGVMIGFIERDLAKHLSGLIGLYRFSLQILDVDDDKRKARVPCVLSWAKACEDGELKRKSTNKRFEALCARARAQAKLGTTWDECLSQRLPPRGGRRKQSSTRPLSSSSSSKLKQCTLFSPLMRGGGGKKEKKKKTTTTTAALAFSMSLPILRVMLFYLDDVDDLNAAPVVCKRWRRAMQGFMPNRRAFLLREPLPSSSSPMSIRDILKRLAVHANFGLGTPTVDLLKKVVADIAGPGRVSKAAKFDLMCDSLHNTLLRANEAGETGLPRNGKEESLDKLPELQKRGAALLKGEDTIISQERYQLWDDSSNGLQLLFLVILVSKPSKIGHIVKSTLGHFFGAARARTLDCLYFVARTLQAEVIPGRGAQLRCAFELEAALRSYQLDFPVFEGSVRLTSEQARIVRKDMRGDKVLKVIACAGSGKTTLLRAYARARPDVEFLYITYNASVGEEASRSFPSNVHCRNIHKIAYRKVGWSYRAKLRADFSFTGGKFGDLTQERLVQMVVQEFLISSDELIQQQHVERAVKRKLHGKADYLALATAYWRAMKDRNDKKVGMTHDGYLKLYQLSKPDLSRDYDVILVDEAQDCNDAICSLLLRQKVPKFIVGDPNQQIYSFLGGEGILQKVVANWEFHLSRSFRFGSSLAFFSSKYLQAMGRIKSFLFGVETRRTRIIPFVPAADGQHGSAVIEAPHTCICRSNVGLFAEAANFIEDPIRSKRGGIGFVGGIDSYSFDIILDVYNLVAGHWTELKRWNVKRFAKSTRTKNAAEAFTALVDYAKATDDSGLLSACEVAKKYGDDIPLLIKRIRKKAIINRKYAYVTLTTTHKAKGLEWDHVKLGDDFPDLFNLPEEVMERNRDALAEEIHIQYVAMTRAKKYLYLNKTLTKHVTNVVESDHQDEATLSVQMAEEALSLE
eukprot:jgi/Bigna1/87658/estExt_fgenesh1_pg.C_220195